MKKVYCKDCENFYVYSEDTKRHLCFFNLRLIGKFNTILGIHNEITVDITEYIRNTPDEYPGAEKIAREEVCELLNKDNTCIYFKRKNLIDRIFGV